jgi:hypothetical protein
MMELLSRLAGAWPWGAAMFPDLGVVVPPEPGGSDQFDPRMVVHTVAPTKDGGFGFQGEPPGGWPFRRPLLRPS